MLETEYSSLWGNELGRRSPMYLFTRAGILEWCVHRHAYLPRVDGLASPSWNPSLRAERRTIRLGVWGATGATQATFQVV